MLAIDHDIHVLGFATSSRAGDGLIATVGSSLGMAFALQKLGGELSAAQVFEEYVKGTVYVQNEKAREAESCKSHALCLTNRSFADQLPCRFLQSLQIMILCVITAV